MTRRNWIYPDRCVTPPRVGELHEWVFLQPHDVVAAEARHNPAARGEDGPSVLTALSREHAQSHDQPLRTGKGAQESDDSTAPLPKRREGLEPPTLRS